MQLHHVRSVLKGKRVLLFQLLLKSIGHENVHLSGDMFTSLTGWQEFSGVMEATVAPPAKSVDELWAH